MMEITLYPSDIEQLEKGTKVVLYEMHTGLPLVSLILDKTFQPKILTTKKPELSTEIVNNPVGNAVK